MTTQVTINKTDTLNHHDIAVDVLNPEGEVMETHRVTDGGKIELCVYDTQTLGIHEIDKEADAADPEPSDEEPETTTAVCDPDLVAEKESYEADPANGDDSPTETNPNEVADTVPSEEPATGTTDESVEAAD